MVRREAVISFQPRNPDDLTRMLIPLLDDTTNMVRMEVASRLAGIPSQYLDSPQVKKLNAAIDEYIAAMNYSADFAASHHNLGILYSKLGKQRQAVKQYKEAIRIEQILSRSGESGHVIQSVGGKWKSREIAEIGYKK